jgi:CubicO group peptidase (beta-lactamase class C family)
VYKLIITMLLTIPSNVLANKEASHDELTATLEQIRIKNNIPSMAVAIISSGEVTYIKGFGFLDEMQTKPTTDESLFRIASVSKLFTAQAVMQLVEDEKLGLNEKVGQYLERVILLLNNYLLILQG